MKNVFFGFIILLFSTVANCQVEEVGPLMGNPYLQGKQSSSVFKINEGTFDSTFIYMQDTIVLPIEDDFSTDKFQKYNANFSDAGVTFDKVYSLLSMTSLVLPSDVEYTTQVTFYRTIDLANGTVSDVPFTDTIIRIGDLSSYPVTHIPTSVYPPFYIYDTIDFVNDVDTVWVSPDVFQDSATQFFTNIVDPTSIWMDSEVYRNYTGAVEPWSLGVATFDGLDEFGYPYQFGTAITNYADHLTSKPIDMSIATSNETYLSFLYQTKGFGDAPEPGDSLVLEFYEKDLDTWNRIWSVGGGPLSPFQMVHIKVSDPVYYQDAFQFRFRNYGGLSGSLDHFHIDYVELAENRGAQDTTITDFAIVYPVKSLLDTYTSVPWDHYKNNPAGKMSSNVSVVVRNSLNNPAGEQDGLTEIIYNGTTEESFVLSENILNNGDLNYLPWTTYSSFHDFSNGGRFDETKTGLIEEFDIKTSITASGVTDNIVVNDTSYSKQIFENYYSYDDGTAEAAYGLTAAQARLAVKYTPYEDDSLIGARIHFVPSVYDVSDELFLITVWADNGGQPGAVIYEDALFFPRQPSYEYDRDVFTDYFFIDTQKVHVSGTFYIGMKQFNDESLNIGLDQNTDNGDKTYFSINNGISWTQSTLPASVMINPIFSTSDNATLEVEQKYNVEPEVRIFPNPTNDQLTISLEGDVFRTSEIFNLQGVKVYESDTEIMSISNLPTGMYLVMVNGEHGPYKIIKQ